MITRPVRSSSFFTFTIAWGFWNILEGQKGGSSLLSPKILDRPFFRIHHSGCVKYFKIPPLWWMWKTTTPSRPSDHPFCGPFLILRIYSVHTDITVIYKFNQLATWEVSSRSKFYGIGTKICFYTGIVHYSKVFWCLSSAHKMVKNDFNNCENIF